MYGIYRLNNFIQKSSLEIREQSKDEPSNLSSSASASQESHTKVYTIIMIQRFTCADAVLGGTFKNCIHRID